jgi:uncharacterized protein (TIGR03084 family)
MVDIAALITDLTEESEDLDRMVADLPVDRWAAPTPAAGWSIAHQIAHLAWTDHATVLAATDPDGFAAGLAAAADDPEHYVDRGAEEFLADPPDLLARWRAGRKALTEALAAAPPGARLPWYGPPMAVGTMVTARIMETWAHGQDVADTLAVMREPTPRLRHVAHLGLRTREYGFIAHGRPAPTTPVRLELTAPDGSLWTLGPPDAPEQVSGPALDFCLLVTQRRNRADLTLVAHGSCADEWLDVAQCFAGPAGSGRPPEGTTP